MPRQWRGLPLIHPPTHRRRARRIKKTRTIQTMRKATGRTSGLWCRWSVLLSFACAAAAEMTQGTPRARSRVNSVAARAHHSNNTYHKCVRVERVRALYMSESSGVQVLHRCTGCDHPSPVLAGCIAHSCWESMGWRLPAVDIGEGRICSFRALGRHSTPNDGGYGSSSCQERDAHHKGVGSCPVNRGGRERWSFFTMMT